MTLAYSERAIHDRLAPLGRRSKTAVAAANAERLFPLYMLYSRAVCDMSTPVVLRSALDDVWAAVLTGMTNTSADPYGSALSLVPKDDDPTWVSESAFAQNAAAAVAYAWQVWVTDDAQQAVWGLRQTIEAADFAAQSDTQGPNLYFSPDALVEAAAAAIEHDIELAEHSADELLLLVEESKTQDSWAWQVAMRWQI